MPSLEDTEEVSSVATSSVQNTENDELVPIDSNLVVTAKADDSYLAFKLQGGMPAYEHCVKMLAQVEGNDFCGAVFDLSKYLDSHTTLADMSVPFTKSLDRRIEDGDSTLISVDGLDQYLFLVHE